MAEETRSEGQRLLEQLLQVHGRFSAVASGLDALRSAIGAKASRKSALPALDAEHGQVTKQSFFDAFRAVNGNLEAIAGELERNIEDLKRCF